MIQSERELFRLRIALLQAFLETRKADGILLSRVDNFAMATGGKRNYVYSASDGGACSLYVTRAGQAYFVGNNIEAPRVMEEELAALGCEVKSHLWWEGTSADLVKREFTGTILSDDGAIGANVHGDLAYLRSLLTTTELEKYRLLGKLAAESMTAVLAAIKPGMPEAEIAGRLIAEGAARRSLVPVHLIAADDRIARHRHPLPTIAGLLPTALKETAVRGYVMVVGCFLREGLVVSLTRFKRVGDVAPAILDAYDRVCGVDAIMQEATAPGKTLGDVFAACQSAYRTLGFPENEWHNHHQGGTAGYAARSFRASPGDSTPILDPAWAKRVEAITGTSASFGQALAWNPSAVGVKSEDTFLLGPDGKKEIVTATPSLPKVDLERVLGRKTDVIKYGMA